MHIILHFSINILLGKIKSKLYVVIKKVKHLNNDNNKDGIKIYFFFKMSFCYDCIMQRKIFNYPNIFWDNEFQKNYSVVCLQL